MSGAEKRDHVKGVELKGKLAEFRTALEQEIEQIKKNGQSSTILSDGRRLDGMKADYQYRFAVEYCPNLPDDTPCKLFVGKDCFDVTIIRMDEKTITVMSKIPLPDTLGTARLENGSTVLMERLIQRIEENAEKPNPAGVHMLPDDNGYDAKKIYCYDASALAESLNDGQRRAVIAALTYDITYIWGPPGTGKTTVIGQIIDELFKQERSVLVVSHTNTAVDGAIEKADKTYQKNHLEQTGSYPILRLGKAGERLPERLSLDAHTARLDRELQARKEQLETRQTELNAQMVLAAKGVWLVESRLPEIRDIFHAIEQMTEKIAVSRDKLNSIEKECQRIKREAPDYAWHHTLKRTLEVKRSELAFLEDRLAIARTTVEKAPRSIQQAFDEAKKHSRYAELQEQASKYMSDQFLEKEIAESKTWSLQLEHEIEDLRREQQKAQETIQGYERKGALARLFSRKDSVSQAKADRQRAQERIPEAEKEYERENKVRAEYERQLEDLRLLRRQMEAVRPSQTKDYWERVAQERQKSAAAAEEEITSFLERKTALLTELRKLEERYRLLEQSLQALDQLRREQQEEAARLVQLEERECQDKRCLTEYLDRECGLCASFYTFERRNFREAVEALSEQFEIIRFELEGKDLSALQERKRQIEREMSDIIRQLNEIELKKQGLERQAVMEAKIIGATLAKSYLSDTLRERTFDTIILDEASMASIPALWCAGYLAEKSIVIVGDFLQLSPIVMSNDKMAVKWLGKDIFEHSGMQARARKDTGTPPPDNFVMLNEQFRMESDIADIANLYYEEYKSLASYDHDERREEARKAFYHWYSDPYDKRTSNIHLIDTESLHAWVTGVPQGKGHSRLNYFSAALDVELAFELLQKKLENVEQTSRDEGASILIIAPYKPHISYIKKLLELEYESRGLGNDLGYIRAGTIHSFQGSEADIVIFDLVVDEPHWRANLFMQDPPPNRQALGDEAASINDGLRKMFNVAVTRARFKLYIVGDFAFCQKRAKANALGQLLDLLINKKKLEKEDAKKRFADMTFDRPVGAVFEGSLEGKHVICRDKAFDQYFMADVRAFQKRLIIYSPFMTEQRLSKLLPVFQDRICEGKQIVVVTKAPSDRGKRELASYQKCERGLRDIGVIVIHKKGMHEKIAFIDSTAIWNGSLNILSFTGATGEVMNRYADRKIVAENETLFGIEHICNAAEHEEERYCPICGGEMVVRDGAKGGIYWECIHGDYTRDSSQQYPIDGILRCKKCGAPYRFVMKTEPRWVCTQDTKHFQRIHEGDLRLRGMAALLSKTEREAVDRFFADRKKSSPKGRILSKRSKRDTENTEHQKEPKEMIREPENSLEQLKLF